MTHSQAFSEQIGRIEGLVHEIESTADPAVRATAKELVQSVMDLHGAGIERIMEIVSKAGDAGTGIARLLAADELVSSLLVLYDLHPEDFSSRVQRGVEKAQQSLNRHGASLTVLAVGDKTVHLRIQTSAHTCGSTAVQLQSIARGALFETVPDAVDVVIDPADEQQASGFVPLESLKVTNEMDAA